MIFSFDRFTLDVERFELARDGEPIELQTKVLEVLFFLVSNGERLTSKDAILDAVWDDSTVSEASLSRCISLARKALGDGESDDRIIQTVRGRGFRIGVPVTTSEPDPAPRLPRVEIDTAAPAEAAPTQAPRRWPRRVIGALLLAILWLTWLARPYATLGPEFRSRRPTELPRTTIAVLPFAIDGVPDERRHLSDTLAAEIAIELGKLAELQVVGASNVATIGGDAAAEPTRVGRALGAGTIVRGRVQPAGARVRIAVEVLDSESGLARWADAYDSPWSDLLPLQEQVAAEVVRAVSITTAIGIRFVGEPSSVEAGDYIYAGRIAVFEGTRADALGAVDRYERSVELDPENVEALAALAIVYDVLWNLDGPGAGWLDRGEATALHALDLDPESIDALTAHGTILRGQRKWVEAEHAYQRAIELGGSALAYEGLANLYNILGRPGDALAPAMRSVQLAPLHPSPHRTLGRVHFFLGDDATAISHFKRSLELRPESALIIGTLATAFERNGQPDEAAEALTQVLPPWARPISRIHMRLTDSDASLRLTMAVDALAAGKRCGHDSMEASMVWAAIGDREKMFECLREASSSFLWYLASEPIFDPYRDDPTFRRIVSDAGFPVGGD